VLQAVQYIDPMLVGLEERAMSQAASIAKVGETRPPRGGGPRGKKSGPKGNKGGKKKFFDFKKGKKSNPKQGKGGKPKGKKFEEADSDE
jgi:hypothetical protein